MSVKSALPENSDPLKNGAPFELRIGLEQGVSEILASFESDALEDGYRRRRSRRLEEGIAGEGRAPEVNEALPENVALSEVTALLL